jgi:3,4-dihydroxy 2-butanone 4-phosphate synthase/GTP cyclohydrolase II
MLESQIKTPSLLEINADGIIKLNALGDLRRAEWYRPWQTGEIIKNLLSQEGESMVEELGRAPLPTEFGNWTYIVFGDRTHGNFHEMLVFGNIENGSLGEGKDILVRIHSACRTNEIFHAVNCECRKQLQQAMQLIQQEERGVILYLDQEGRGNGIVGKLAQLNAMFTWENGKVEQKTDKITGERIDTDRAYKEAGYPSEARDFTVAGQMLKSIGIKSVRLLTNNPVKIAGIESEGIEVTPVEIHILPDNEIIATDLRSKARNLGHKISQEHWQISK